MIKVGGTLSKFTNVMVYLLEETDAMNPSNELRLMRRVSMETTLWNGSNRGWSRLR